MLVTFNEKKLQSFLIIVFNQDFIQYKGMTSKYRAFEDPNLPDSIKISLLKKLSVTNHLDLPSFENFWNWIKSKHGTELATILTNFIFPTDIKMAIYMKNSMNRKINHDLWMHIKARVYKKWCSIVTEMQCIYAVAQGAKDKNWQIISSPELDAIGIDFAVVKEENNEKKCYPIQIKKDSYSVYAQNKYNSKQNFDKINLKKKALYIMSLELEKLKINAEIKDLTILKYGLPKKDVMPYNYLKSHTNGFIYYDAELLTIALEENL